MPALLSAKKSAKDLFQPVLLIGHLEEDATSINILQDVQSKNEQFYRWIEDQGVILIHRKNLTFQDTINTHYPSIPPNLRQGPFLRLDISDVVRDFDLLQRHGVCQHNDVVLYTDCDVMFTNVTRPALETIKDFVHSNALSVAYGPEFKKEDGAFNTGVMFLSVGRFGSQLNSILDFGEKHKFNFPAFDQGLLNAFFENPTKEHLRAVLPLEWNYKVYWGDPRATSTSSRIVHFHGPKPNRMLDCLASMDINSLTCQKYKENDGLFSAYKQLVMKAFQTDKGLFACKILNKFNQYLAESVILNETSDTHIIDCPGTKVGADASRHMLVH